MNLMRGAAMRRKGEPVWVLMAIIGGWIGVRAATWDIMGSDIAGDPAFARIAAPPLRPQASARAKTPDAGRERLPMSMLPSAPLMPDVPMRPIAQREPGDGAVGMGGGHRLAGNMPPPDDLARRGAAAPAGARTGSSAEMLTVAVIDGGAHGEALTGPRAAGWLEPSAGPARTHASLRRWSGDAWLLWRRDGDSAGGGGSVLLPSYGANQVGAVLRYRLAPASGFRPTAYVRAYGALNGTGEREVAAGLSARPLPAVPVMVMGEARASHFAGGTTHIRPAVTLVTELPPVMLPGAMRAATYVQGGYVGGAASTAFVDGQFRLEHIAAHSPHAEVRLGGGIWGGAQTGAQRMDVGPTATLAFTTAGAGAHVSVDWRFRVAGNAMPGSGPAVTLAAGF